MHSSLKTLKISLPELPSKLPKSGYVSIAGVRYLVELAALPPTASDRKRATGFLMALLSLAIMALAFTGVSRAAQVHNETLQSRVELPSE